MNGKKIGKGRGGLTGAGAALPITMDDEKAPRGGAAIPSDHNVAEAKDWVDHNKK